MLCGRLDLVEEEEGGQINTVAYILLTVGLVTTLLLIILIFSVINAKMTGTCCFKATNKVQPIGHCFYKSTDIFKDSSFAGNFMTITLFIIIFSLLRAKTLTAWPR